MDRRAFLRHAGAAGLMTLLNRGAYAINPDCQDDCNPGPGQGGSIPESPPPEPSGPTIDIAPFLIMNVEDLKKGFFGGPAPDTFQTPIHMRGLARCPEGYVAGMCEGSLAEGGMGEAYHLYVLTKSGKVAFGKARGGGGIEIHRILDDRVVIEAENLSWNLVNPNSVFRTFEDHLGRPGAIWVGRNVPHGFFRHEGGKQYFHTCGDPSTITEQYNLDSIWGLLGPYAIDTSEGLARARSELRRYVPKDDDKVVPDQWLDLAKRIPNVPRNSHVYLIARPDGWGYKSWPPPAMTNISDHAVTEVYFYLLIAPSPDMAGLYAGGRGLGMSRWVFHDNVHDIFVRDTALLDPIVDKHPQYFGDAACKGDISPAMQGIGSSQTARQVRRTHFAYSSGELNRSMAEMRHLHKYLDDIQRSELEMQLQLP